MSMVGLTAEWNAEYGVAGLSATGSAPWVEPHWYAVQTVARHEKAVSAQLAPRTVESFLPLQIEARKWGERKVTVEVPLFSGYVFARFAYRDRLKVLTLGGVLRIVSFNGLPFPLLDEEIMALRSVSGMPSVQRHQFLEAGRRVRINSGALEGLEGVVVKRKSNIRFVISVQAIRQSIAVEVSERDLQCIK
jgi:transcriptional antiterminator NusG